LGFFGLVGYFAGCDLKTLSGISPPIGDACNAWAEQPGTGTDSNCNVSQVKTKQVNK